jgi:hypothetical protein
MHETLVLIPSTRKEKEREREEDFACFLTRFLVSVFTVLISGTNLSFEHFYVLQIAMPSLSIATKSENLKRLEF